MDYRYLLLCMLGAVSFACGGAREPSVTVNSQLLTTQNGVQQLLGGDCATYQHGQAMPPSASTDQGAPPFVHVASRAPDLEVAQTFNGQWLSVAARTTSSTPGRAPEVRHRTYTFDFLVSGERDSLTINSARGGTYELQHWGSNCCAIDPRCGGSP